MDKTVKEKVSIVLSLLLCLVILLGCSTTNSIGETEKTGKALVSGKTSDEWLEINIFTVTATKDLYTEDKTSVHGSFSIRNLKKRSFPVDAVFFGILDEETQNTYWGSVEIDATENIPANAIVHGTFNVKIPQTVSFEQCTLIFGSIPDITFKAPLHYSP